MHSRAPYPHLMEPAPTAAPPIERRASRCRTGQHDNGAWQLPKLESAQAADGTRAHLVQTGALAGTAHCRSGAIYERPTSRLLTGDLALVREWFAGRKLSAPDKGTAISFRWPPHLLTSTPQQQLEPCGRVSPQKRRSARSCDIRCRRRIVCAARSTGAQT